MIQRGNHKSSKHKEISNILSTALEKEVMMECSLSLPIDIIGYINDAEVVPLREVGK